MGGCGNGLYLSMGSTRANKSEGKTEDCHDPWRGGGGQTVLVVPFRGGTCRGNKGPEPGSLLLYENNDENQKGRGETSDLKKDVLRERARERRAEEELFEANQKELKIITGS